MIDKNIRVENNAYSISFVAVNAMSMRDMNLKILFSNNTRSLSGILIALPEKRP
jgi:hypothetical protein